MYFISLGMTSRKFKDYDHRTQFQSAMRNMVVTTIVQNKAGYFFYIPKYRLISEQVMTYFRIECDTIRCRFKIQEDRAHNIP